MFLVDVGSDEGVRAGAAVVSARGLVGRIREVRSRSALGMDWANPDFRASAMLADGSAFGIVENARGDFREQDRLMLNGTAFHETVPVGTQVLTSGLGGLLPRGIPIGRIEATAEVQGTWLRSYWLRPAVMPGSVTHVLVETEADGTDLAALWATDSAAVAPAGGAEVEPVAPPLGGTAGAVPPERQGGGAIPGAPAGPNE
jgi:rod shape-determining protein MreC